MGVTLIERRDIAQSKILRHWLNKQVLPSFATRIINVALCCANLHVPDPQPDHDAINSGYCINT